MSDNLIIGQIIQPVLVESDLISQLKVTYLEKTQALIDKINVKYGDLYSIKSIKKIELALGDKQTRVTFDSDKNSTIEIVTTVDQLDYTYAKFDDEGEFDLPEPVLWVSLTNMKDKARVFLYTIVCCLKPQLLKANYTKVALLRSSSIQDAVVITFIDFEADSIQHIILPSSQKPSPLPGLTNLGIYYHEIPFIPNSFFLNYLKNEVFEKGYVLINKINLNFALYTLSSYRADQMSLEQYVYDAKLADENLTKEIGILKHEKEIINIPKNIVTIRRETNTEYVNFNTESTTGTEYLSLHHNTYQLIP